MNITLDFDNATRSTAPGAADIAIPIITDNELEFSKVICNMADDYCVSPGSVTEHYVYACEAINGDIEIYISFNPHMDLLFINRYIRKYDHKTGEINEYDQIEKFVMDFIKKGESINEAV